MNFSPTSLIVGTILSIFAAAAVKQKNYLVASLLIMAYIVISYLL